MACIRNVCSKLNADILNQKLITCSSLTRYCSKANAKPLDVGVDWNDVKNHSELSEIWWESTNPLHALNEVRIPYIRNGIRAGRHLQAINTTIGQNEMKGLKMLDVGCGGGILSEALARLEANVTGIDPSSALIKVAKEHAARTPQIKDKIKYECINIHEHAEYEHEYDVVVLSEVIEHIYDKERFLKSCVKVLKYGGSIFITTPNRTALSYLLTVELAERFGIVPYNAHNFKKFIRNDELKYLLRTVGCFTRDVEGITYNPFTRRFRLSPLKLLLYALHAQKFDLENSEGVYIKD